MSNSMILAAILKIFKLGHYDVISQLANICFRIQHTKLPLVGFQTLFFTKCMYLLTVLISKAAWMDAQIRITH